MCSKTSSSYVKNDTSAKTGGTWVTRPFSNWKKAVSKMKEHAESEGHVNACQVEITIAAKGTIIQQVQQS